MKSFRFNWLGSRINGRGALAMTLALGAAACTAEASPDALGNNSAAISLNSVTRESFDNQGRQGNAQSSTPSISPNQRYVVFQSKATTWANGINTNGVFQIYVKDRQIGSITLASQLNGAAGNGDSLTPSVADDGSIAFVTGATNLGASAAVAKILVRKPDGTFVEADVTPSGGAPNGGANNPQIAGNGSAVVFQSNASNLVAGDTNGTTDVFVAALGTTPPTLTRISKTESGVETNGASFEPTIDYAGRIAGFATDASNIAFDQPAGIRQVFSFDLQTGFLGRVSFTTTGQRGAFGTGNSDLPQVSGDGKTFSFRSFAANFDSTNPNGVPGDIYAVAQVGLVHRPLRVSVSSAGAANNGATFESAISFDGSVVAFASSSTNLAANATDGLTHVFVRDRNAGNTVVADRATNGLAGNGGTVVISTLKLSGSPTVPAASFVVFDSDATNLVTNDTNGVTDVFSASLLP